MSRSADRAGEPLVFTASDWAGWTLDQAGPATATEAVAGLLALRHRHLHGRRAAESALIGRTLPDAVLVVGLAGPVASGKTTVAAELTDALNRRPHGPAAAAVSTDGFLRSNADLDAAGLTLRKGFPESYDYDALRGFHAALRSGQPEIDVPLYSHETYDIATERLTIARPDVLVLEGVNALQAGPAGDTGPAELTDLSIYIDVDEAVVTEWFAARFLTQTIAARSDPASFYRHWADLNDDDVLIAAREVWAAVNSVNLRDHIGPSRSRAVIDIVKSADHRIEALRLHPR